MIFPGMCSRSNPITVKKCEHLCNTDVRTFKFSDAANTIAEMSELII